MKNRLSVCISLLLIICVAYEPNAYFIGLLLLWLLLQLMKFLSLYIVSHEMTVTLSGAEQIQLGEATELQIALRHKSPLPIFFAKLEMELENTLTAEKTSHSLPISLAKNDEQQLKIALQLEHCGVWTIRSVNVAMPKLLSPAPKKLHAAAAHEITVLPTVFNMAIQLKEEGQQQFATSNEQFQTTATTSERFGFRPYRKGDAIKSIHWKLSAKQDELVVSEHLEEQQTIAQFYIEKTEDVQQYEILLTLLFSMLHACKAANKQGRIRIEQVDYSIISLEEIAHALLSGKKCEKPISENYIAIVAQEVIEHSQVFRLKAEEQERLQANDFTMSSMPTQFARVIL